MREGDWFVVAIFGAPVVICLEVAQSVSLMYKLATVLLKVSQ